MNRMSINSNGMLGSLGALQQFYYTPTSDVIFNAPAYLRKYPNVAADPVYGINPMMHYIEHGYDEGLDPTGGVVLVPQLTGGGGTGPGGGSGVVTPVDTTIPTTGGGVMDWMKQNPLLAAGIAIAALFAIKKLTKKRK